MPLLLSALISSCNSGKNEELIAGASQDIANNIIMLLGNNDINASKAVQKDGSYTILINSKQKLAALNLLKENGLPQQQYVSMGDVFKKDGFISSPLEEHGRFLFAIDQQISDMLSAINGVITVKTVVNIPQPNDNLWQKEEPNSSAAVIIKYKQGARIDLYINRIKQLVSNSVPGLSADHVEVISLMQKDN